MQGYNRQSKIVLVRENNSVLFHKSQGIRETNSRKRKLQKCCRNTWHRNNTLHKFDFQIWQSHQEVN